MVGVAQLVRAPGCGPGGRRFKSGFSPHFFPLKTGLSLFFIKTQNIFAHLFTTNIVFLKACFSIFM